MRILFKKPLVWVIIVVLLSSIFRLSFLNLIEFKSDEATTVYQTVQFFNQPYLAMRGLISGTGVYNFPLFNYLIIPIGVWSQDPQFISWVIAFINSLLVAVFFLLVKKYYGFFTSLVASLLVAFSPWSVLFSRKIWAQDLINLLFIPFFWLLHELVLRKNTKVVLPMFLLLAFLLQLHGSGIFLLITTLVALLVLRVGISIKEAVAGFLIGLIPVLPYIFFQINTSPACSDCEALLRYQQASRMFDVNNLIRPFQVIAGLGHHSVLGKSYPEFLSSYPLVQFLKYIFASGIVVIWIGIISVLLKNKRHIFLAVYFFTTPFLYLITKTPAYMHYFVAVIPISALLFAISITDIYDFIRNRILRALIVVYVIFFLVSNIAFLYLFNKFLETKKQIDGDYGPIYSVTKSFIEEETKAYISLPYYRQLKSYAYIYAQSDNLHSKLGEFFINKGAYELAEKEFAK